MDLSHTLLWLDCSAVRRANGWFPWHGLFLRVFGVTAPVPENLKPALVLALPQDGSCFSREYQSEVLYAAEKILSHEFDLLGSGPVKLGDSIDWSKDFKSGKTWPMDYYANVHVVRFGGADVKVPWELSRFQHLTILGEAYLFSGDDKYYVEFKNEVEDWFVKNPFCFGVNWTCAMDVAIRAVNWVVAYHLFHKRMDEDFRKRFLQGLFLHGRFIRFNLEYLRIRNNHYYSDVVGLVWLGLFFRGNPEADGWRKFGVKELEREMKLQVYPDGVDFEASTCYHRLMLELSAYTAIVCKNSGIELCDEFWSRLELMFDFALNYMTPIGTNPQVGDNDNGRLLVFVLRDTLDNSYLPTIATVLFKDSKYKIREYGFDEEALWIFGLEGKKIFDELPYADKPLTSKAYPNGGFYILRDDRDYCLVSCSPASGHGHNDKLSLVLWVDGKELFVDPGTYVYTCEPKMRNMFRGTRYHNTVVVDNLEQNEFVEGDLFKVLSDRSKARCLQLKDGKFSGEHYGYSPVFHRRTVSFDKERREWVIADSFSGGGRHRLEWNYHLSDSVSDAVVVGNVVFLDDVSVEMPFEPHILDGWISSGYGERKPAKVITGSLEAEASPDRTYQTIVRRDLARAKRRV